ncbi:MAG: hypothetical protein JOY85_16365 [Acidobacteriaceae bacterium]|nr:hypothetical protein [Acidobacteriaceae bacterium]
MLGINYYRHRFVRSNEDLLALLPSGDATRFFADVQLLRRAGTLKLLEGTKVQHDSDYGSFVWQSGFNYEKDLDTLAGAAQGNQLFFLLRGRFHWDQLRQYASAHGGTCAGDLCKVPAPKTGRWAGFFPIQPDVLAVAVATDPNAVNQLKPAGRKLHVPLPEQPVWVSLSESLLRNPVDLPLPLKIFAIALQSSHPVVLSLDAAAEGTGSAFKLQLDAACQNQAAAETVRSQLEIQTKMLKLELARERQQPNPADLTGLLTAGNFQVANSHLIGVWPVRTELLQALQ